MDSRVFINEAKQLIDEIKVFAIVTLPPEEEQFQGQNLQKRIAAAFGGLHNPTLPSAFKLLAVATAAGFFVDTKSRIVQEMARFDFPRN